MPDPKPQHPVARAIWEALQDGRLTDLICIPAMARSSPEEAQKWDRVAREAELNQPSGFVLKGERLSREFVAKALGVTIEPLPTPPDPVSGFTIDTESAHRREGGGDG